MEPHTHDVCKDCGGTGEECNLYRHNSNSNLFSNSSKIFILGGIR